MIYGSKTSLGILIHRAAHQIYRLDHERLGPLVCMTLQNPKS